ncbi:hypothetical protein KCTC52924_02647 [Arenibacter antarcticus]
MSLVVKEKGEVVYRSLFTAKDSVYFYVVNSG